MYVVSEAYKLPKLVSEHEIQFHSNLSYVMTFEIFIKIYLTAVLM